jgi:N4-gp56 family major capsid protein
MVLDKLGQVKPLPKNKSQTIAFRRPNTFQAATNPLVEGTTPTAGTFSYTDVQTTLKQYGEVRIVTDVIEDTHEDQVLNDIVQQLGDNIGRTMEALTWGVIRAGTNVAYANGVARTDVNTPVSLSKIRAATATLKRNKGKQITKTLDSSVNFATRAIEPGYVAVCHTDLDADIRSLPGFVPVAQYGTRKTVSDQEIGTVETVRFITSPDLDPFLDAGAAKSGSGTEMISTTGTSADVYPILVLAQDAFATVALRGAGAVDVSIIPVNQRDKNDPLGQRGYAGWKAYFAALILNQSWMVRLEVAATKI